MSAVPEPAGEKSATLLFRWLFPIFAVLSLLTFGQLLNGWFQEDDYVLLQGVRTGGPFGVWTHAPTQFFRPLVSLSMWAEYHLFGLDPLPFRVFNSFAHAAVATMVAVVVRQCLGQRKSSSQIGLFSGLLFLVWPSHSEAIFWISARTDLMATFFGLLSIWFAIRYTQEARGVDVSGAVLAFAAGLLCKESIIVMPGIAVAFAWISGNRKAAKRLGAALVAVVALYLVTRIALIGPDFSGGLTRSPGLKILGATAVAMVRCLLPGIPFGDPGLNSTEAIRSPIGVAYLALGVLALFGLFWSSRKQEENAALNRFLWISFGVALLPALGLAVRLFRSQGERFLYFPSVFLVILVVVTLYGAEVSSLQKTVRLWKRKEIKSRPEGSQHLAGASKTPGTHGQPIPTPKAVAEIQRADSELRTREVPENPGTRTSSIRQAAQYILPVFMLGLLQLQQSFWILAANQSHTIQTAFMRDVVQQHLGDEVAILDLPTGVQGAYGVLHSMEALPPLFADRKLKVHVLSAFLTRTGKYQIQCNTAGGVSRLQILDGAEFNADETASALGLNPALPQDMGFLRFGAREARIDLRRIPKDEPIYFWDGERFSLVTRS